MLGRMAGLCLVALGGASCRLAAQTQLTAPLADGELLYNGIRLPAEWPPRHLVGASREPLPVPYLDAPPAVIPIDVGRQLFVDDFFIAQTTLRRTFHHAQKYDGNPVLKPETPQEITGGFEKWQAAATACPFDDGVFFDPRDRLFKLWYMGGMCRATMLATSSDGLHWTRPSLDVEPGTNVVIPWRREFARDAFSPWLDYAATDPAERWKAFLYARTFNPPDPQQHAASFLYTSPDGLHWRQLKQITATVGDNTTIFYNPFRQKWVMSVRDGLAPRGRARFYFESDTFAGLAVMKPREAVFWSGADRLDPPDPQIQRQTQLYCLSPIAYESLMLGAFAIHYGPENGDCAKGGFPKLTQIELGFSRDGFHFSRPDRTPFIAATQREGDWDRGYLRPAGSVCTIVGDQLYFYYCGFSGVNPDGKKHMYAGGSTHVAMLRRDGFASLDAGEMTGTLTTRPLTFHGQYLFVNLAVQQGELRVEVLDEGGKVIVPFTAANCIPLTGDSTRKLVTWRNTQSLAILRGQTVRLRFTLTKGSLYAFWVSPEKTGASHGYVAAGGPEFDGPMDPVGGK